MKFNKNKFISLSLEKQHKELSKLLKKAYIKLLKNLPIDEEITLYNTFLLWINEKPIESTSLQSLSDKFHYHLRLANINIHETDFLPSVSTLDIQSNTPFNDIAIYLDNLRSAQNIGSIIRTTEALRIGKIYFSKDTPFIDHKKVIKTSMGTSDIVPCFNDFDLNKLPRPFIGLETEKTAQNINDFSFPKSFTLILGNEEYGISQKLLKSIDIFVKIPLLGNKNSINVACAYAIAANKIIN